MKKSTLLMVLASMFMSIVVAGCGNKEESKEAGFDNTKPVPAEDGGGAKTQ